MRGASDAYREFQGISAPTYAKTARTFPIKFDRYRYYFVLVIAIAVVIPFMINDYWVNSCFLPFLASTPSRRSGLNILVGYCGQPSSLGPGGFIGCVGLMPCYKS